MSPFVEELLKNILACCISVVIGLLLFNAALKVHNNTTTNLNHNINYKEHVTK